MKKKHITPQLAPQLHSSFFLFFFVSFAGCAREPTFSPQEQGTATAHAQLASQACVKIDEAVQVKSGALENKFVNTLDGSNANSFTGLLSVVAGVCVREYS